MSTLKSLFNYLEAEEIYLDEVEFEFQFNSHPDYPSLLALSDTLMFFNIKNAAFNVSKTEIDLLPNKFLAKLKKSNSDFLSYVQKKDDTFIYSNGVDNNSVSKTDFESYWSELVILVENDKTLIKPKPKNRFNFIVPLIALLFFASIILLTAPKKWFLLFYTLPIIGLLFSIASLKDLFNTKNELLNKFCNISANTNCNTIVNSTKWKVFNTISFSDLSIVFFSAQTAALFSMGLLNLYSEYFAIQTLLLFTAIPVLFASLYYQKYIEKKWCPICLVIIGVVILEIFSVLIIINNFSFKITLLGSLIFLATMSLLTAAWLPFKQLLKRINQLKTAELKANRFKRNYVLFKKMLMSSKTFELPKALLVFGNPTAQINISIVTSPYCGYCEKPHYILKSILEKYEQRLNISILYKANPDNVRLRNFAKNITHLKLKKGNSHYYEAMDYWYQVKEDESWLNKYRIEGETSDIDVNLDKQNDWFEENSINFTPLLFINGFQYPKEYDFDDLPFFIEELLEDKLWDVQKIVEAEKL